MGSKKPSAPSPPSPTRTATKATQAQIAQLPLILQAQEEYGPKFTQADLELLREFAPQVVEEQMKLEREFGPELARLTRERQALLAPETIVGQERLQEELERPVSELLTPEEEQQFKADLRAAQSVRGLAESGEAAIDEIRQLTALRQQIKAQRLNLALSAIGRVPIGASNVIQTPTPSPGQLVQNVTPSDIFGLTASNYQQLTRQHQTQAEFQNQRQANFFNLAGSGMSMIGNIFG